MHEVTRAPMFDAYRPDIDGMRAIAVLLVLIFHFDLVPGGKAGFIGVDIFFVISGYLITSIIKRQLDDGAFSLKNFYVGRVRRLAPALLVVLLLTLTAGIYFLFPDDLLELARQTVFAQLYIANIYYWQNVNYFGLGTSNVFLLHMWSLAVEEQFYLIFPLALLCLQKYAKRNFWLVISLAFLASFTLNVWFSHPKPEATFYLLPTRAWELLAGSIASFLFVRWARSSLFDQFLGLLGIGLICIAVGGYNREVVFPGYFALLPVLGAACLLLAGNGNTSLSSRLLRLPVLAYIGRISYPLYLVHWPINVFASRILSDQYDWLWRLGMFALSAALASAIYFVVENPIRHRKTLAETKRLLQSYGAGLVISVFVFILILQSDGLPQRFPDEVIRLSNFVNDRSPPLLDCQYSEKSTRENKSFCKIGDARAKPTWIVYGDSHAWAAHAAFDEWLKDKGESGLFVFRHGCIPVMNVQVFKDKGECFAFNDALANYLRNHSEITKVVLVSTWRQAIEGALTSSNERSFSKEDSVRLFEEKFTETVSILHSIGKSIYIWEPVPGATKNVPISLAMARLHNRPANIEITREAYLSEFDFFFSVLERNKKLITLTFSPSAALCQSGMCSATINGDPAYFDSGHVTHSSAKFWVNMMRSAEVTLKQLDPTSVDALSR